MKERERGKRNGGEKEDGKGEGQKRRRKGED